MRARLAVGDQGIERGAGQHRRFAILAGDFDISGTEAAQTIGALPAEQLADDKTLPGLQDERLICPFAGRMAQMAEEIDGVVGGDAIPDQSLGNDVRQVRFAIESDLPADCRELGNCKGAYVPRLASPSQQRCRDYHLVRVVDNRWHELLVH